MYIAIYEGTVFNHWALFIENEVNSNKGLIMQVMGCSGHWTYERRLCDLSKSATYLRKVEVASILKRDIGNLKVTARELPFGESAAWNCQSWVMDLIQAACENDLIELEDDKLHSLFMMQDGLVRNY